MNEEKLLKLSKELKYLLKSEREKELIKCKNKEYENSNVINVAREIYASRGIDYNKLHKDFFNNLVDTVTEFLNIFKGKDKKDKRNMIIEVVYMVILLILIKVPFDLVKDIGLDYIEIFSTNNVLRMLWQLAFMLLYTVTLICTLLVLLRNFNKKYRKN